MRLRVLSYNIHRAIGLDRRFRPQRIERIVRHHSPDVVLLQEVDRGVPRSRGLDMAAALRESLAYPFFAVGHNVVLRQGTYGNATLSRFPILAERNIDLTIGRRKRRGCQHVRLLVARTGKRRLVDVFNLHLGLSAAERSRQLSRLASSREFAALGHDGACLVGGDFNDWRSRLDPFLTRRMDLACATARADAASPSTYPSFSPAGRLDRIWYRGPVETLEVRRCALPVSRYASDHLPIVAEFAID